MSSPSDWFFPSTIVASYNKEILSTLPTYENGVFFWKHRHKQFWSDTKLPIYGRKVGSFSYKQIFRIYFFQDKTKIGYYYCDALYFPIEPEASSMPPQCLLNESSSLLIAFVCPSLTNVSAKVLLFNPFLRGPKNGKFWTLTPTRQIACITQAFMYDGNAMVIRW